MRIARAFAAVITHTKSIVISGEGVKGVAEIILDAVTTVGGPI